MTPRQFEDLLDTHGPDLARWPEPARREAEALLTSSEDAREALRLALIVRRALEDRPEPAGDALRRAILAIPVDHPRTISPPGLFARIASGFERTWVRWSAGVASGVMAGLTGFVLGFGGYVDLPGLESGSALEQQFLDVAGDRFDGDAL